MDKASNKKNKVERTKLKDFAYNSGISMVFVFLICGIALLCHEFIGLSNKISVALVMCSVIFGAVLMVLLEPLKNKSKLIHKTCKYFHVNYYRNAVLSLCFVICCWLIKKETYLEDQFDDILTLSWTIFGIAISVFCLWYGLASTRVDNILKDLRTKEGKENSLRLNEKASSLNTSLTLAFLSASLLIINTIIMISKTSLDKLAIQCLLIICLCLTCAFMFTDIFAISVPILSKIVVAKFIADQSGNRSSEIQDKVFNPIYKYFNQEMEEIDRMDSQIKKAEADENCNEDEINSLIDKRNEKLKALKKLMEFYNNEASEFLKD